MSVDNLITETTNGIAHTTQQRPCSGGFKYRLGRFMPRKWLESTRRKTTGMSFTLKPYEIVV